MMYGKLNPDLFCRVLEQIYAERNSGIKVKVTLVSEEEAEEIRKQMDNNRLSGTDCSSINLDNILPHMGVKV